MGLLCGYGSVRLYDRIRSGTMTLTYTEKWRLYYAVQEIIQDRPWTTAHELWRKLTTPEFFGKVLSLANECMDPYREEQTLTPAFDALRRATMPAFEYLANANANPSNL